MIKRNEPKILNEKIHQRKQKGCISNNDFLKYIVERKEEKDGAEVNVDSGPKKNRQRQFHSPGAFQIFTVAFEIAMRITN